MLSSEAVKKSGVNPACERDDAGCEARRRVDAGTSARRRNDADGVVPP
jgi:hypothetical protein